MTPPDSSEPGMIIALVRHGETEWNRQQRWQGRQGVGLNELGRAQAAGALALLDDRAWSWMVSSPLERAQQTATIIASGLSSPVLDEMETDDDLVERAYGEAEGMPSVEANLRWPDGRYPGMESDQQLRRRGAAALRRIAAARNGDGVIVAHGSLIRATISELCRIEAPRIANGSVNLIRCRAGGWRPLQLNRTAVPDRISVDAASANVDRP